MDKLKVINFKSIGEIEIEPKGQSFTLKGRNGAGKTAMSEDAMKSGADKTEVIYAFIIDAIRWALQGNEDDQFSITRSWKRGKTPTVKVTDKDGKIFASPQKMLDEIVSNLSFDPTDFLLMKPEVQVKALRDLVDPDGNIAKLEDEEKTLYDKRRDVGRDLDRVKKTLDTIPKFDSGAGLVEMSRTEIMGRYEEGTRLAQEKARLRAEIDYQSAEIKSLKEKLEQTQIKYQKAVDELDPLPHIPNLESIKVELDNVDSINTKVRDNQNYQKIESEFKEIRDAHNNLDVNLETVRTRIDHTIKNSPIPVEGMAFDENGITLDGKRFDECSDGERLEASLRISMALNKGLRMIAIRNGSLLDPERQKRIMDFAREQGYQVILEVVGKGDITVEIEQEVRK